MEEVTYFNVAIIEIIKKMTRIYYKKKNDSIWSKLFSVLAIGIIITVAYFSFVLIYIESLDCTKCSYTPNKWEQLRIDFFSIFFD